MYKAPLNERGFSILVMDIMRIEVWRMKTVSYTHLTLPTTPYV
mgnify:CR=1 FL=1